MATSLIPVDYAAWLLALKQQIRTSRVKAGLAVNKELVMLYWRLGNEILNRQNHEGWGTKVIEQLAKDLKSEFPDMKGLSRTNLLYSALLPMLGVMR
jgi:predicted nuclease of restriction endonuclease-like (RecB) superfamily